MTRYLIALLIVLLATTHSSARFTDFEDLTNGEVFSDGGIIHSKGLTFQSVAIGPLGSHVHVGDLGVASGPGLELVLSSSSSTGLDFFLPPDTRYVTLHFYSGSATSGFIVNGIASPLPGIGNFDELDGSVVGGVLVSATPTSIPPIPRAHERGELVLTGDIQSLRLHGSELWIDNVRVAVPEPATLQFLLSPIAAWIFTKGYRLRAPRNRDSRK